MSESFTEEILQFHSKEEANPYTIVISNVMPSKGEMRVEPPFEATQDWLDGIGAEGQLRLKILASDKHATMLDYQIPKRTALQWTEQERLRMTAGHMINALGQLASSELFIRSLSGYTDSPVADPEAL